MLQPLALHCDVFEDIELHSNSHFIIFKTLGCASCFKYEKTLLLVYIKYNNDNNIIAHFLPINNSFSGNLW